MKVFDILRLLIADDFLATLGCDRNILSVLLECCDLSIFFCANIFDKICLIATQGPSDGFRPTGFICDDIDSSLTSALVTLQMALLNQLLKYESLTCRSASNTVDSETNYVPNTEKGKSTLQQLDDLSKIRSGIALVSLSVTRIVSSVGAVRILRDLAVNDKELISTLLHGCEVELRLTNNADMTCERDDNTLQCDISQAVHCRDDDASTPTLPLSHSCGRIGSSSGYLHCSTSSSSISNSSSANGNQRGQDSSASKMSKDGGGDGDGLNIKIRTLSGICASGPQISSDYSVCPMRHNCKLSIRNFSEINFDGLSCFLLFVSQCISYDASLFCDFLCSPETEALKYILRATKRILQLEKCTPHASTPSSSSTSSSTSFTSYATPLPKIRMKKRTKKKSRIRALHALNIPRNEELFGVCLRTVIAISVSTTRESEKTVRSSEECSHRRDLNLTISWIKREKSVFIDETREEWQRDNVFNDESLWGVSDHPEVCQSVHPAEWGERDESNDIDLSLSGIERGIGVGIGSISRERERKRKRELCGADNIHSNPSPSPSPPVSLKSNHFDSSTRSAPPNGHDIRSCGDMDLDLEPDLESACALYGKTLRFFTDLQRLLLRLGNASRSRRRVSMPFDCSLLISRIKRIMILMSKR